MNTKAWWSTIAIVVAFAGCGDEAEPRDAGGKDAPLVDVAAGKDVPTPSDLPLASPDVQQLRDVAADAPVADRAPDLAAMDLAWASEAGSAEAQVATDTAKDVGALDLGVVMDATAEAGARDGQALDTSADGPADVAVALNVTCRTDSDCCITIDACNAIAYLYSKAPGATGAPAFPPRDAGMCLACIPPAVQVRCDNRQCVGEKVPSIYSGTLIQNHCGPVALPDAGVSPYKTAYAGAAQTSWSCGS